MQDRIKIHVMKCGEVGVDPAVPSRDVSKNPLAYTGLFRSAKRRIWLPVFTYLIEHPKGNILVDTGWSSEVRNNPKKAESYRLWFASKPRLPMGSAVDEQIKSRGIALDSLEYVFLTHMDVDHVNGIQMVKGARHIMAAKEEIQAAEGRDVRYWRKQWNGISLEEIPLQETGEGISGESFDVFGDGTIQVIATPGHSAGSVTVLVRNQGNSVLIAGDTGYEKTSWREGRLPGPVFDKEQMVKALGWVNELEKKGTTILACHDPEINEQLIEL